LRKTKQRDFFHILAALVGTVEAAAAATKKMLHFHQPLFISQNTHSEFHPIKNISNA
jgi:hypothetical protein